MRSVLEFSFSSIQSVSYVRSLTFRVNLTTSPLFRSHRWARAKVAEPVKVMIGRADSHGPKKSCIQIAAMACNIPIPSHSHFRLTKHCQDKLKCPVSWVRAHPVQNLLSGHSEQRQTYTHSWSITLHLSLSNQTIINVQNANTQLCSP